MSEKWTCLAAPHPDSPMGIALRRRCPVCKAGPGILCDNNPIGKWSVHAERGVPDGSRKEHDE